MTSADRESVAVVGGGIAGATIARSLVLAGHAVHVFDKARGPGGRLATRRVDWVDHNRHARTTRLAPDMPALCRHLLDGTAATWSFAVDGLYNGPLGWRVQAGGVRHALKFDSVVLALPPAQAAPLLSPHRLDWARLASVVPMQPCWTLMGIADDSESALGWDLARPPTGALAWALRNDARPGRASVPGQAHWVAHARTGWSRRQLEEPAAWVQEQMQAALDECVGRPVDWHHCAVHRWRYALPQAHGAAPAASFWWDAVQGLGVCGDFLGGCGVEGAWLSAQSLSAALLQRATDAADASTALAAPEASGSAPWRLAA